MDEMSKLIAILYVLYLLSYALGCSVNGNVSIYSPNGAGNVVEKVVSTNAEIPLIK